ncbi:C4-dicarboxylate ABC transporter permease [Phaeobacter gallaeciensis]|uniref:TRAP transporter large permease protein n=1 Tax=Phaeobacter gallaeciensis TaxID=60890 RepID=A0A1B0ZRJ6_9RHOB|nr:MULTISPECIES: TRAP transporter large permease [Phaeobacter]MDF1771989.1 TRAP transporter large permease [Pseudophaeobacter sp. bin_em_oilr2.035]MEE2632872.1 TRAP transporter large permease [Pseudomonadota bacterium]ANP36796.1 C4-dicarboxylate ABC transporter permease [Phaeobacter gallaeciensis]MDE4060476.1 TRAP transporter large permease [Phaeobacter gallaeciensis]MDE4123495.1 TRAP transporter large permease [Phaeobacter gallaeciensis]
MDWIVTLSWMLGGLAALLLLGLPVAFAFITVTMIGAFEILGGDRGLLQLARNATQSVANFQMAPIPLFILMGELLFQTGIAHRAIDAIERVVTRVPGRLSVVTVFGGTIFAALSGSTIANTAMLGSTMMPGMLKRGYHPTMAMGPIMASGAIAMLIPPSALAVLVGSLAGISISGLLVAGVIPALLLAGSFVAYIILRSLMDPRVAPPDDLPTMSLSERWRPFLIYVAPLSALFAVVIGSLLLGIATPTESAALGCLAALGAGAAYRALTFEKIGKALIETVKLSVMILFIMAASQTFSQILSFSGATNGLIKAINAVDPTPVGVLIGMIVILLLLGCFIDQVSMLMVTVPVFVPLAAQLGINDLVLGVVYLLTMEIGLLTPPFGLLLFVMRGVAPDGIGMKQIYAAVTPFLVIKLAILALLVWQPAVGTWLPGLMMD